MLIRYALALFITPAIVSAADWPAWRGPTGQGVSTDTNLPLEWNAEKNIRWKIPLPGPGNSTPIIAKGMVFITQATEKGAKRAILCFDRENGSELWSRVVDYPGEEPTHRDNPFCSGSPVTDGERVIAFHGSAGLFCYDLDGEKLWRRDLGEFRHIWGNASSPAIHGELCLVNGGPGPRTFLVALDKTSGKPVWQVDIPGGREGGDNKTWTGSWSTPLVVKGARGADELLLSYPNTLWAFRPTTGEALWRCDGLGKLVYTTPLTWGGVVVAMSGFSGPPMALRHPKIESRAKPEGLPKGEGPDLASAVDVTSTHRLWRRDRGPQRIGSGVVHEGHIYIVNDSGAAECLELETGKRVWHKRVGAKSWSSLVLAGDRLYSADMAGGFAVFRAAPDFELLSKNDLGERTRASVAPSNGELFLRTYKHLWCVSTGEKKTSSR